MNWLPMSEAPRDGSRIVAWHALYKDWRVVCWRSDVASYPWLDESDGDVYEDKELTHFLLIEPPH